MEIPRHWRLKRQRYALEGQVCLVCQSYQFPPRPVCPKCARPAEANWQSHEEEEVVLVFAGSLASSPALAPTGD